MEATLSEKVTKRGGQQCNFYIHYEVDDDEVPTVLALAAYDDADEGCWVLAAAAVCCVVCLHGGYSLMFLRGSGCRRHRFLTVFEQKSRPLS